MNKRQAVTMNQNFYFIINFDYRNALHQLAAEPRSRRAAARLVTEPKVFFFLSLSLLPTPLRTSWAVARERTNSHNSQEEF